MGDPQFVANPQMVEWLSAANGVLDRFEDPAWLMPGTQAHVRRQLEERERRERADAEMRQLVADH